MLQSMTGFGCAQAQIEGADYGVEIRSVNGRYFKANIRLPDMWSHAETAIEKKLRQDLSRGNVSLNVRMRVPDEAATYSVNTAAVQRYVELCREAVQQDVHVDVGTVLSLPGVCQPPADETVREKGLPALMETLDRAVQSLLDMRRREGEALLADLLGHCRTIEEQVGRVEARKDTVVQEFQKRLTVRVNELLNAAKMAVNEQDLIREVALFAERSDISEEIARLRSHIEQFRRMADCENHAGRKLEFIAQEMLREANTIGAKANDIEIGQAMVEIKSAIDRVKEQVQNVE